MKEPSMPVIEYFDDYKSFTDTVAVYPEANTRKDAELYYLTLGLTDEAGEVAGKVKKYMRDHQDRAVLAGQIEAELGDVLFYLTRLAGVFGMNVAYIAGSNRLKLEDRKDRGVIKGSGDTR